MSKKLQRMCVACRKKKEKSNMEVYKSFLINTINLHKHAVERIRNEYERR